MFNRFSALALVLGAIAGYVLTGTSATAQSDPPPFAIGDNVTLHYETTMAESQVPCLVADIRGSYVKCENRAQRFTSDPVENWRNMRFVVHMRKQQK